MQFLPSKCAVSRYLLYVMGWVIVCMAIPFASAQTAPADSVSYTFFAGGHWYGAHENYQSIYPASTLLQAVPRINAAEPDFIFALGDVVRDGTDERQWAIYDSLTAQFHARTILTPGNHDLPKAFPVEPNSLTHKKDLIIILGTEDLLVHNGRYAYLWLLRDISPKIGNPRNVFVFSHRLLWALTEPGFKEMDDFANEPYAGVPMDTLQLIYDEILKLAGDRPLYWFSGDIGASWSHTVFEGHSADGKRHFYAAGLGDCAEDAFWKVHVDSAGNVKPEVFWLDAAHPAASEVYDLEFWRKKMAEMREAGRPSFGQRVGQFLGRQWKGLVLGVLLGMGLIVGLRWVFRRRRIVIPSEAKRSRGI